MTGVLVCLGAGGRASAVMLYDPSLGTTPGGQGWIEFIGGDATQSTGGGLLTLDTTTTRGDQAGYFSESPFDGSTQHPGMPTLDRNQFYRVQFQLQVLSESHDTRDDNGDGLDDRAGFSVIAISEDLLGLELGFFEDRVWAYAAAGEGPNSQFTQAEGAAFDTTAALVNYDLRVQGAGYTLLADGAPLLSGNLRNYNPSGLSAFIDPYDNPSFLFFGNDTSSADSQVQLGQVSVVPEPGSFGLAVSAIGLCFIAVFVRRRRRGRRRKVPARLPFAPHN